MQWKSHVLSCHQKKRHCSPAVDARRRREGTPWHPSPFPRLLGPSIPAPRIFAKSGALREKFFPHSKIRLSSRLFVGVKLPGLNFRFQCVGQYPMPHSNQIQICPEFVSSRESMHHEGHDTIPEPLTTKNPRLRCFPVAGLQVCNKARRVEICQAYTGTTGLP